MNGERMGSREPSEPNGLRIEMFQPFLQCSRHLKKYLKASFPATRNARLRDAVLCCLKYVEVRSIAYTQWLRVTVCGSKLM